MAPLADRLAAVREQIEDAARDAGRDPTALTTVVVTKFQPASLMRELYALGVRDVGESRHQEARVKRSDLDDLDLTWHFVGQLQSKKARQVAEYCRVIHSVDRESLVRALTPVESEDADAATGVFLQLDLDDSRGPDPTRGGSAPADVERMTELIASTAGLRLLGVMAVAPLNEEPRSAFARLRAASERMRELSPESVAISAGMSGDFRDAVLEGATHLRIGTAITGNRPPAG